MSMRTWNHPRHLLGWVFIGFLVLFAVSIAASLALYAIRGTGATFGFFPFFPFGFGWIFFLFFLFFWGFRWWGGGGWGWYGRPYWRYGDDAHAILRTRYARGEITREQFEQMMRDLEQHV
jgi:putative membrane protein